MPRLQVRTKARSQQYAITIGRGVLYQAGKLTRQSLGNQARRIALISNEKVFSLYGKAVTDSLESGGFSVSSWLMKDGERFKSIASAERALQFLSEEHLERSDGVVSLGGGVVNDLAGFAASVYLRGIPFISIPTTLLAQIDSSVGGKTGVNLGEGKNLVGSFHQPSAVLTDVETLLTLPRRELVAGWCECVKQGAVAGEKLFSQTTTFLAELSSINILSSPKLERLIASHCSFKATITQHDEREATMRVDNRSRRILNFGHTVAHALETITGYRKFRHGEAVGYGMLVAGQLSKNMGLLPETELELLQRAIGLAGPLPAIKTIDETKLMDAITRDKKRAGGEIKWVLLERIGRPRIIGGGEISQQLLKRSLRSVLKTSSPEK